MKTQLNKRILILILCSSLPVLCMISLATVLNEPEIIFPETVALSIGAILAPKQPWKVRPLQMILLMAIYSTLGLCLVKYIPSDHTFGTYGRIIIALFLCEVGLIISKSTFYPLISSSILPILMHTESWIYPLSAIGMTIFIVLVQKILSNTSYAQATPINKELSTSQPGILWLIRFLRIAIIAILPLLLHWNFCIAPPLIVAFMEITSKDSPLLSKRKQLLCLTFSCCFLGSFSRVIIQVVLHQSIILATMITIFLVFVIMHKLHLYFPPAGALSLLCYIIPESALGWYPVQVAFGFLVLIVTAIMIQKVPSSDKENLIYD